jgi:hypothetical protein
MKELLAAILLILSILSWSVITLQQSHKIQMERTNAN